MAFFLLTPAVNSQGALINLAVKRSAELTKVYLKGNWMFFIKCGKDSDQMTSQNILYLSCIENIIMLLQVEQLVFIHDVDKGTYPPSHKSYHQEAPSGAGHYVSAGGEGLGNFLGNPSFLRRPSLPNLYFAVDPTNNRRFVMLTPPPPVAPPHCSANKSLH